MRFHLPKPLHGWREFAGEVGIIVLGVLIALGAGQVVDTFRQRSDLAQLRDALHAELADDRARWEDIRAGDECTVRRLDALEHWLDVAPADARLNHAYTPFLWNTHTSAWDSAKSSPAGQLLGLNERLTYASLYEGLENWRRIDDEEERNAGIISADFATANQPENRRELPKLLVLARRFLISRQINYPYFFTRFDELKIRPDSSHFTLSANPKRLCAPLGS
ncbi:MAG TPA: hypothetical protein VIJ85_01835 [Rhizomicrobium sp.]